RRHNTRPQRRGRRAVGGVGGVRVPQSLIVAEHVGLAAQPVGNDFSAQRRAKAVAVALRARYAGAVVAPAIGRQVGTEVVVVHLPVHRVLSPLGGHRNAGTGGAVHIRRLVAHAHRELLNAGRGRGDGARGRPALGPGVDAVAAVHVVGVDAA